MNKIKQAPATPLPWAAQRWSSHAPTTVLIDDQAHPLGKRVVADCEAFDAKERVIDAAYIAHAANAYPKLIEALSVAPVDGPHPADNDGPCRCSCCEFRRLRAALLLELGESE